MKLALQASVLCLVAALLGACGGGSGASAGNAETGGASGGGSGSSEGAWGTGGVGAGGEGGADNLVSACTDGSPRMSVSYPSGLLAVIGSAASAEPVVSGMSVECMRSMRFTMASGTLPPGMQFDASNGRIAGTPTVSGEFRFEVRLTVDGFDGFLSEVVAANINSIADYTFSGWEVMTEIAPFLDDFRISTLGGKLYVVSRGFYSHGVETYESTDGGATWNLLPVAGPSGDLRNFALAADPTSIFLSGGSDGTNVTSVVWRFDGASWTQATAAAAFPARESHAMVSNNGALYVLGGRAGTTFFADTWRSIDSGATWTLASIAGIGPRYDFCALSDSSGSMYVVGGKSILGRHDAGATVTNVVFRSPDGINWADLPVPSTSPLMTTLQTMSGACAMLGNRIVYVGDSPSFSPTSSVTVSSTDGVAWNFEPHATNAFSGLTPGGVALGGRVYVTAGSGTSQRFVVRSVP